MKKQQTQKLDWADKAAIRIMNKSSTTGRRYYNDLKKDLELKTWSSKDMVPVWCGTKPIVAALRRAYRKGFLDRAKK